MVTSIWIKDTLFPLDFRMFMLNEKKKRKVNAHG